MEGCPEPGLRVLRSDVREKLCNCLFEGLGRSGFGGAEELFELGPGFLDGIEVRRVGRQVEHFRSGRLDPLPNAGDLV